MHIEVFPARMLALAYQHLGISDIIQVLNRVNIYSQPLIIFVGRNSKLGLSGRLAIHVECQMHEC